MASKTGCKPRVSDRLYPAYDLSAVPVDDGDQIHVAAIQLNKGDVNRPVLIWKGNRLDPE